MVEVGKYEDTPESLEAAIKKLHPDAEVSQFSRGTWYLAREKRGLGYVRISVVLFHKNGAGNSSEGNGTIKTEPAMSDGSYNVRISVSSPEADCKGYIDSIVQEAGITLLPELDTRSISPNELNGTGYAGTPQTTPQESTPLWPRVAKDIQEILEER